MAMAARLYQTGPTIVCPAVSSLSAAGLYKCQVIVYHAAAGFTIPFCTASTCLHRVK